MLKTVTTLTTQAARTDVPQSFTGDQTLTTGNLVIATNGKGVDFTSTPNGTGSVISELFNDYESGSFTPGIVGASTAGTATYAVRIGRYTKVGNRVLFNIFLEWSGHTGTGTMRITGLPFTSIANSPFWNPVQIGFCENVTTSANTILNGFVPHNSTEIWLGELRVGGGVYNYAAVDAAGTLNISGHYEV